MQIDTGTKILNKININQGVRQGCDLSLTLFNIYIEDLLRNWKHKVEAGIMLKRNLYLTHYSLQTTKYVQDSEDKLQKSVCFFKQLSKDHNLKISTNKTKIIVFKEKHLVHSKIKIGGSVLEQVKHINYLGCKLSLDGQPDFDKKINRFQNICGTIRKHLKKAHTETQEKFYKVIARPTLPYGSKT
jgi:hypothetical protein